MTRTGKYSLLAFLLLLVVPSFMPINKLHNWRLHLETADGKPVDDATLTIKGEMPGHGHGLPTQSAVTQKPGNGDYLVEGIKFQITGWWNVDFGIESSKGSDTIGFNFITLAGAGTA